MKTLLSALLVLPLLAASATVLADREHGRDRHDGRGWHDSDRHGHGHDRRDHDRRDRGWYGREHRDRGWHGHPHRWERGRRYVGPIVVVHDYPRYRLRPPPRGYRWLRDEGNDFVLVAIATGVILDVVLN